LADALTHFAAGLARHDLEAAGHILTRDRPCLPPTVSATAVLTAWRDSFGTTPPHG
jgi:hypothetical protein